MKPLLIIIDLQKGWWHSSVEEAMLNTVELCKKFDGDIIQCRFRNDPESSFHKQIHWHRFMNESDTDEIPEIASLKLPTYWRSTYSCVNEETLPIIKRHSHAYVAGVFTDVSVAMTAMAVFDEGVPVSVVGDCVATLHGPVIHEASLKSFIFTIGRKHVVEAAELI